MHAQGSSDRITGRSRGGSSGRTLERPRERLGRIVPFALIGVFGLVLAAGCSAASRSQHPGGGHSTAAATLVPCGTARTAANVPVRLEIARGNVSCSTARTIESGYAKAIRSGQAPGNGGGGPVKVGAWTCQGFATPVVLQTGKASKCVNAGSEILEMLASQ